MVSHDLPRSTITSQIAFDQRVLPLISLETISSNRYPLNPLYLWHLCKGASVLESSYASFINMLVPFQLSVSYFHILRSSLKGISCHGRNYSQPYFFKRNQSSDNLSHGFGAKFLLKKLSASDVSYERKSALNPLLSLM